VSQRCALRQDSYKKVCPGRSDLIVAEIDVSQRWGALRQHSFKALFPPVPMALPPRLRCTSSRHCPCTPASLSVPADPKFCWSLRSRCASAAVGTVHCACQAYLFHYLFDSLRRHSQHDHLASRPSPAPVGMASSAPEKASGERNAGASSYLVARRMAARQYIEPIACSRPTCSGVPRKTLLRDRSGALLVR
jgi:hypothetical protein